VRLTSTALLAIACGICAFAASDARAEDPRILRAETIEVLDERVRPAEVYQDVPVETEVLTADDLRQLPAINLIEALDNIPGLVIQGRVQGQRGAVRIDGLPPEYTELLVNGQRYAGENGEAVDLGDLLFADVERVEILRGPQALRVSSRAAGGVINLVTRKPPTDGWALNVLAGGGDHDRRALEASAAYGTEKLSGSLIIDHNGEGGFDNPFPGSTDPRDGLPTSFGEGSTYRTTDVYTTLFGNPSDEVEIRARFGYRLRDEGFAINNGPITSRREDERFLANLESDWQATDDILLYSRLTFSHNTTDTSVGRPFVFEDDYERLEFGTELFAELWGSSHIISLGADLVSNGIELTEGAIPTSIDNPSLMPQTLEQRTYQAGIFLVAESEITDWFSLEGGLRFEMRDGFTPELLPQAAVLLTPLRWGDGRSIKLRLSGGRAARYPSLRELYQPDAPQNGGSYFLAGNSDLEQETVWAVRGSIEINPVSWLSGTVSGFYSETENRIRSRFQGREIQVGTTTLPADPALCPVFPDRCTDQILPTLRSVFEADNIDSLQIRGIEARLEFRPYKWLELQVGYTWLETALKDSNVAADELPNNPRHIVSGKLVLSAPQRYGSELTLRGGWRDRALIENSGTGLVSFVTDARSRDSFDVDMRLRQPLEQWIGVEVDLFVDGGNLSDNRVVDSNQIRGRSFFAGIQGRFN
jgi:outer membrane receptor protein involved in Fe transport